MTLDEQANALWPLFRAAGYLVRRGMTFGAPLIPSNAIQDRVWSVCQGLVKGPGIAALDQDTSWIAPASLDHVLITPMIEAANDPYKLIAECSTKVRMNGHIVVIADVNKQPHPGGMVLGVSDIKAALEKAGHWRLKSEYLQAGRYVVILKRTEGRRGIDPAKTPPQKRACVCRYGAMGDAVIMTPLIRRLAEDGYAVTLNISTYCEPVIHQNPFVSNIIRQERDMIPNPLLDHYWKMWAAEYDKYINLSESIEGDLLMVEGRKPFFTTKAWRHKVANRNYYDYTFWRAGYDGVTGHRGELYFTQAEERKAEKVFEPLAQKFTILWALNGSSHHKVYPMMEPVLLEWFKTHPDTRCITVGDYAAKILEFEHPQVIPKSGVWSIRESLIAAKYVDLVIGPESVMTNAAGCFPTPKIVLLSHSTRENLTKYFENDYSLEPDQDVAPCYPCHQLHYSKESCPMGEMKDTISGEILGDAPICSMAIAPTKVLEQIDVVYQKWLAKHPRQVEAPEVALAVRS